jgi:hypothetical protein
MTSSRPTTRQKWRVPVALKCDAKPVETNRTSYAGCSRKSERTYKSWSRGTTLVIRPRHPSSSKN